MLAMGTKNEGMWGVREKRHPNLNSSKLEPLKKSMFCLVLASEVRQGRAESTVTRLCSLPRAELCISELVPWRQEESTERVHLLWCCLS